MKTLNEDAFAAAERYMVLNARLVDRLRFDRHFRKAPAELVHQAVFAYQNLDGGFGNAIEPDLRGGGSQPQGVEVAFWMAEDLAACDPARIQAACHWLEANSTEEGGVPWVLPSVIDDERAPWWQPPGDKPPAAINPTGPIVGMLHAAGVEHPWIAPATEFCWGAIAAIEEIGAYDALSTLAFLERVPDRDRAEAEFRRLNPSLRAAATIDPDAPGHVHSPLDLAPRPDSLARRLFSEDEIDLHLDVMIQGQNEDGGWATNFAMWTPLVTHEWGGYLTLANLRTLKAYGRIR